MATKNILIRGGADFSGVKKELQKTQQQLQSFQNGVSSVMKKIGMILATIGIGKAIKDATKVAMEFEAAFGQIGRIMGANAGEFTKWAYSQASALAMSKAEIIKYGAVYGNLISGFAKNSAETMKYTQDLLRASSIIASATGRSIEDVMDRIRSGLLGNTEAIEDLGINVNIAMIESTEAFKKFANGKSWQQLDFQTQQQIRLMAILEQSFKKYGDSVIQNTALAQAQFLVQLKNIQLSLGQAFLPIYNVVLPILTAFASKLAHVIGIIAQFSQALFGKSAQQANNQAKAANQQAIAVNKVGDAYKEAGKKAKGAVATFDEINQLPDLSTGAGVTQDDNTNMSQQIPEQRIMSGTISFNDEISPKIQEMANKIKAAFGTMADFLSEKKDIIISALAGIGAAFATFLVVSKIGVIVGAFETLYIKGLYLMDFLKSALAGAFSFLVSPIGAAVLAIGALVAAFVYFYRTNESFRDLVGGILDKIKEAALSLWNNALVPLGNFLAGVFKAAWQGIIDVVSWLWQNILIPLGNCLLWLNSTIIIPLATIIKGALVIAFDAFIEAAKILWQNVLVPLGSFIGTVFVGTLIALKQILLILWNEVFAPLANYLFQNFKPVVEALSNVFIYLWKNVLIPLIKFIVSEFVENFRETTADIKIIIQELKKTFEGIITFITGIFTRDWEKAWSGVKKIFGGVFDSLYGLIKTPMNLIIGAINSVIRGLSSLSIKVPDWVPGFGGKTWGISIPEIPRLARGGIVDSPTVAMIGEAGKEMVVPLENTQFVDKLASALGTAVLQAMQINNSMNSSTQSKDIVIQIDGTTLARVMLPKIDRELQRMGRPALIQSNS